MRIVFLGTPDFAVPTLEALINSKKHEILLVVTQPDKARDRGHELMPSPVKVFAKDKGLGVMQYKKIRVDGVNDLKHLSPDIMVTCAYGQILSQEIIDIPKYGIINVHASLLPKYRGSAPISWAVINGETKTGITLMRTESGIDTGDMLGKIEVDIDENETSGELFDRLSKLGGDLLLKGLDEIEKGAAVFTPQDESLATHARMLKKTDGLIDFSKSAKQVKDHIRGMNPWPTAFFMFNDQMIKVYESEIADMEIEGQVGEVVISDCKKGLFVKCGEGVISLNSLQYPNSKRVDAKAFLNGREIPVGTRI
ncbi:MAG: methionyl-tRNA formyltransferase [Clostridia bacterium]